jgi:hypothetical protein
VIEQSVDWSLGMQGKITEATIDASMKGRKSARVVLATTSGNLSLNIGICAFVYEEPREAKPDVRAEAESATISALSVFFPSNEVFVFYELREDVGEQWDLSSRSNSFAMHLEEGRDTHRNRSRGC